MALHGFPEDKWTALMHSKLTAKVQRVFAELSFEDCQKTMTFEAGFVLLIREFRNFIGTDFALWIGVTWSLVLILHFDSVYLLRVVSRVNKTLMILKRARKSLNGSLCDCTVGELRRNRIRLWNLQK